MQTATKTTSKIQTNSIFIGSSSPGTLFASAVAPTAARANGCRVLSSRPCSVNAYALNVGLRGKKDLLTHIFLGILFQKLPNLRLAQDVRNLKYTPPEQNVGITELPVVW